MSGAAPNRRILVVLAHPDDESFICGGTLARYAQEGAQITYICATLGEMGRRLGVPPAANRESLPTVRRAELEAACRELGIDDLRLLGLRDKTLDYYDPAELAALIRPAIKELKPEVIITFNKVIGGHPDHCAIGRAARMAWQQAGGQARLYELLWSDEASMVQRAGATPDRVTRIAIRGGAAEAKVNAYRAHRTQSELMTWLWQGRKEAVRRLSGTEYFLQASGPARRGETDLLP